MWWIKYWDSDIFLGVFIGWCAYNCLFQDHRSNGMDEICYMIGIGNLISLLVHYLVVVILMICFKTTELIGWMKCVINLVLGL